jgi:hypothetical protein
MEQVGNIALLATCSVLHVILTLSRLRGMYQRVELFITTTVREPQML